MDAIRRTAEYIIYVFVFAMSMDRLLEKLKTPSFFGYTLAIVLAVGFVVSLTHDDEE